VGGKAPRGLEPKTGRGAGDQNGAAIRWPRRSDTSTRAAESPRFPIHTLRQLVRAVFERYASGIHSLRSLQAELPRIGLRNKRGGAISLHGLSNILNNPFYCGLIRLRATGQTFKGVHEPLVSVAQFERVQALIKGKAGPKVMRHEWTFRRAIRCALCGRTLTAERQKSYVYYRCHTSTCATTGIREEAVEATLLGYFAQTQLLPDDARELREHLALRLRQRDELNASHKSGVALRLADAKRRMQRLTDALIDDAIDRKAYEERKCQLMLDIARLEEDHTRSADDQLDRVAQMFELAASLVLSYDSADPSQKREIIGITTSNLALRGKHLEFTPSEPFRTFAEWHLVPAGDPQRDTVRTSHQAEHASFRKFIDQMCRNREQRERLIPPPRESVHSAIDSAEIGEQ